MSCKDDFCTLLDKGDYKYENIDDSHVVLRFIGPKARDITIHIYFEKDEKLNCELVALRCYSFSIIPYNKSATLGRAKVIEKFNELNSRYRWVRFFVDNDDDCVCVAADCVAIGGEESIKLTVFQRVMRLAHIYDEAYPQIMRTIWADEPEDNQEVKQDG